MASRKGNGRRVLPSSGRLDILGTREGLRLLAAVDLELKEARRWMQSPKVAIGRLAKAHNLLEELIR